FAAGDARVFAGAGAVSGHDADDRVIYNTSTGQLFYDADGSGGSAAQLMATLQGATALSATDIVAGTQAAAPSPYNVRTLVATGPSDNRVDMVFLGDGYTAGEMAKYTSDILGLRDYMFSGNALSEP